MTATSEVISSALVPRAACSLCRAPEQALRKVLGLRPSPLANGLLTSPTDGASRLPLDLVLCATCGHLQIGHVVDPEEAFSGYRYATGTTSPLTATRVRRQAGEMLTELGLDEDGRRPVVVEVGSNDGTLLAAFQELGCVVQGIDPAREVAASAIAAGVPTEVGFLGAEVASRVLGRVGPADLVVAHNVLAHGPDVLGMLIACRYMMGPRADLVIEVAHALDLVRDLAFDTIYHEHYSYHALGPLKRAIEAVGLVVMDAARDSSQVGRGSLRVLASMPSSMEPSSSVEELLAVERDQGLTEALTWNGLHHEVAGWTLDARARVRAWRGRGLVAGFGAPAKMATLTSQIADAERGLPSVVDFTVDESSWKQGLFDPVSRAPICGPDELHRRAPPACIIFAWNFAEDIMRRHASYPGTFIVPLPRWREYPLVLRQMEGLA